MKFRHALQETAHRLFAHKARHLAAEGYQVAILSSRSHQWGGRRAMKRYLRAEFIAASALIKLIIIIQKI